MKKYKPGDIVRRIDTFHNPHRIDHFLVFELGPWSFIGQEYKVFHIEENEVLELFLKSSETMTYKKVA